MVSLLVALAAAVTVGLVVPPGDTGDLAFFMHSAERLFSGGWAQTYADPTLQVGPLQLVVLGALDTVAGLAGISSTRLIGAVFGAVVVALFWLIARRLLDGRGGRWALTAAVLAPVALSYTFDAYRDGHPAQALVPLLWVLAGFEVRAGRWLAGRPADRRLGRFRSLGDPRRSDRRPRAARVGCDESVRRRDAHAGRHARPLRPCR